MPTVTELLDQIYFHYEVLAILRPMLAYAREHLYATVGDPGVVLALTQIEVCLTDARARGARWHLHY